jgi:RNA recognition motif-containing protein
MAVYIGNVARDVISVDIYDVFKPYGDILDISMYGKYAFLSYRDRSSVDEAIKNLDGKHFFGSNLIVKV